MVQIPNEFPREYDEKGEKFYEIAELLYTHPERQFTQDKLAEQIGRSNTTINNHIRLLPLPESGYQPCIR